MRFTRLSCALITLALMSGCSRYMVRPPGGADLRSLTAQSAIDSSRTRPTARFPASLAVARVQSPSYREENARCWGGGAYQIVLTRTDVEDRAFDRMKTLPMLDRVTPLSRLVLPEQLNTDAELRQGAAALSADLLLIYTVDTAFYSRDYLKPLTVVTLGLSPNKLARVNSTASAVLMDTRTGYIYALAEATAKEDQLASAWTARAAVDQAKRRAEAEALDKLSDDFGRMWSEVINQYAHR